MSNIGPPIFRQQLLRVLLRLLHLVVAQVKQRAIGQTQRVGSQVDKLAGHRQRRIRVFGEVVVHRQLLVGTPVGRL